MDHRSLLRLQWILRRHGDKSLRDEGLAIVTAEIEAQASGDATARWWTTTAPGIELSRRPRQLIDLAVVNDGATADEIAAHLGIDPDYARRLVSRTSAELFKRNAGVEITFDGSGVARTAAMAIVAGPRRVAK